MERKQYGVNRFKWPRSRDLLVVDRSDLLLEMEKVTPLQETEQLSTGEIVWCALTDNDFVNANEALKRVLREEE